MTGVAAAQLAAVDKAQTMRQLGVGNAQAGGTTLLSILCKHELEDGELMDDMDV
jgi:hypothetical protein